MRQFTYAVPSKTPSATALPTQWLGLIAHSDRTERMMESEQFKTQRGKWSTGSQGSATRPPQIAALRAALLFGCYRRGDANDPKTYCTAISAVLATFAQHVVEYVTDPRTGIPGTEQWLPSV